VENHIVKAMILISICLPGCRHRDDGFANDVAIEGHVCTKAVIRESLLRAGVHQEADCKPVGGASIYLAYDEKTTQPIEQTRTQSEPNGDYKIPMKAVPLPRDPTGYYYLVIEKRGYQRLVHRIKNSGIYPYARNTAVLKADSD
jgi:hypothetical protein